MSGIDAAGLVLAVFPIVVRGLQQFTKGLETIKDWKRHHRELSNMRELTRHKGSYTLTLPKDHLRVGIIQSNDVFGAFIEGPGHAVSCNPQYEKQLRIGLGHSYDNDIKIMVNLLDA